MSELLLLIVTLIYAGISISEFINGHGAMSIVFVGYTIANLGLMAKL